MYKKKLYLAVLPIILISSSCGKFSTTSTRTVTPVNVINEPKTSGFSLVSGNAYQSIGRLAKEHDSSGKNHIIEIDNSLKYNLNGKDITYYSFTANVMGSPNDSIISLIKENGTNINMTKISQPNSQELNVMAQESLKYTGDKTGPAIFNPDVAKKLSDSSVVYWQDSDNQTRYTFLVESSLIQPFKSNSKRLELHIKSKTNATFDDWLEPVRSPIHVMVIGDSVMWGQGLAKDEKFLAKVTKQIGETKGQIVRFDNYARSGSIFGDDNNNLNIDLDGEIASHTPTINAQLKRISDGYKPFEGDERVERPVSPKRIDLLVMDGGINNVGPISIFLGFDPTKFEPGINTDSANVTIQSGVTITAVAKKIIEAFTSQFDNDKKLKGLINDSFCYNEARNDFSGCTNENNNVQAIMTNARKMMPNAQVDMMGYFPLLSNSSKINCQTSVTVTDPFSHNPVTANFGPKGLVGLAAYMAALPSLGPSNALLVGGAVSSVTGLLEDSIKNRIIKRSASWTNLSNNIINHAVELVNNDVKNQGRGLLRFIPVAHIFQNNAAFSDTPYLWGTDKKSCMLNNEIFPAEDSVSKQRGEICKGIPQSSYELFFCNRYSLFHPNVKGVDNAYVPEIINSLQYSGFMKRPDL